MPGKAFLWPHLIAHILAHFRAKAAGNDRNFFRYFAIYKRHSITILTHVKITANCHTRGGFYQLRLVALKVVIETYLYISIHPYLYIYFFFRFSSSHFLLTREKNSKGKFMSFWVNLSTHFHPFPLPCPPAFDMISISFMFVCLVYRVVNESCLKRKRKKKEQFSWC